MDIRCEVKLNKDQYKKIEEAIVNEGANLNDLEYIEIKATDKEDEFDVTYKVNNEPPVNRIRRITGYLVGTLDRFNTAKRAEVLDRTKHV